MRCSKCGTNNPSTNNFCAKCGNALAKHCAKCKAENPSTSDFCGKCGAPLTNGAGAAVATSTPQGSASNVRVAPESSSPEALDGERKTVTALFADIKGSTELMRDLDPEEARAIVDPALKLMIEAVRRYDGYVVQSTGDGIFALFGAPVAHEDHPQRALYAGLMQEEDPEQAVKRKQPEPTRPLATQNVQLVTESEVLQLQNHPTTESAGNNRDDGTHELEHAGDTTAALTKTLDF
jgi:ribosomal protein L40E